MGQRVHRPRLRDVPECRLQKWIVFDWSLLPGDVRPKVFRLRPRAADSILMHEGALPAVPTMHLDSVEAVLQAERIHVAIRSSEAGVDGGRDWLDLVTPKNVEHLAFGLAFAFEHD